jgi:formate dehydrogenase accessory protein FdhE
VNHDRWDARIARARELAVRHPAASEILTFYAQLAGFQQRLLGDDVPEPIASCIDRITEAIPEFLAFLTRAAPARLAESAALMREDVAGTEWRALIERYGNADEDADASPAMAFVVEALLQPFAEAAALALQKSKEADATPESGHHDPPAAASPRIARCPACSGKPVVGLLREEGQSARRSLVCGSCLHEWPWPRIVCPACGEDVFESLPVYQSETLPNARVDACETCRTYLKTIDLSKDALAIPIVDDLASIALDLWARQQGYTKLRANILRM